ncbi:MAG: hypothetical protein K1X89_30070, partial [Myxococcaceae bacterium]|nr:hypothetical protein [Myxococcaceae bacterium]
PVPAAPAGGGHGAAPAGTGIGEAIADGHGAPRAPGTAWGQKLPVKPGEGVAPAKPHAPAAGGLQAKLVLQGSPQRSVLLTNLGGTTWSSCTVTIPGQQQRQVARVAPGFTMELPLQTFGAPSPSAPALTDAVRLDCGALGSVTLPAR